MVFQRASAAGCAACRVSLVRIFAAPATPALRLRPLRPCAILSSPSSFLLPRSRFYSTDKAESLENPSEEQPAEQPDEQEEPWYLQEEAPRHPTLIPTLAPLPDIPEGAPAILADLVKQVVEDMGLDELNLLDLRKLNPPAALGPNLIMLFGTARSERHLHVAAGRLKSWLRERGIRADADGWLGKNEFKIKMRRRMKKARLLGVSEQSINPDDGLATRWICVNLGTIGTTQAPETTLESSDGRFAGFGTRQTGTTIVVQMMVESKRKELNLEKLWSDILARGLKNQEMVQDDIHYIEANTPANEIPMFDENVSDKGLARPQQRRFFSTSCRRLAPPDAGFDQVTQPPPPPSPSSMTPGASTSSSVDTLLDPMSYLTRQSAQLADLQAQLQSLSAQEAVQALSPTEAGRPSAFMRKWNNAIRYIPPEHSWELRHSLAIAERRLGVPTATLKGLQDLVEEMELLGVSCTRDQFLLLLQVAYVEPVDSPASLESQSKFVLEVTRIMAERGEPILTVDVTTTLIESLARSPTQGPEQRQLQSALETTMKQADMPWIGEDATLRLLDAYAMQDNWDGWWQVWRMAPKHLERRSERLYTAMWRIMADTNHQARCREAVRICFPEMLNEEPTVQPVGELKEALEACLRVADPAAEEIAKSVIVHDMKTKLMSYWEFVHIFRAMNPVSHRHRTSG
ncbi:hypothetical protein BD289DRAFT_454331 [Coniella lustricola]|uniref:ATPase synthesis protein 25 n=1 Tax=Coniella lustricola TaxID=2025994 RepID=A0A2T3A3V4_9PEZI|nr:hypothetical protein BD289DRAFT_454331 [Coniella lustricola]